MSVEETLAERGVTHGYFSRNAAISQAIKSIYRDYGGPNRSPIQWEALDLIATKISRILSTDGRHSDDWHDIAGYAMLMEKWLREGEV